MGRTFNIPAPVDPHVHLRGMEWSHKATFASETAAAVAGGYWAVFDMPNTPPNTTDRAALDRKLAEMSADAVCDWGVYFGASQAGNWDEYLGIVNDVCGLKMFCNDTTGTLLIADQTLRERHIAAWPADKPIVVHAEGETVREILSLIRQYRKRTHFLHISTAEEIRFLTDAKAEGLPVTLGVCPHHLWLTENDVSHLGTYGLMKPELKTASDQAALWHALETGIVDVIESDHAPHTLEEKASSPAPYGVPGLETTLPLLCTALHEGRLTQDQIIALVSTNPRRIFGLKPPAETYTVIDLDTSYEINRENLHTRPGWSPFEGMRVHGKVTATFIRSQKAYDGERILARPGFGKNLYD